jgi:RimJ/RimL family protein N-acetyltransferase
MAWAAQEPLPLDRRREMIEDWNRGWADGGDVVFGVFLDGQVVGGCGLHRRIGPSGLEIGYWIHASFLRQGLATRAAAGLTDAALELPDISRVEIQHEKANVASAGVPRRLGFRLVSEVAHPPEAPAETGVRLRWRMDQPTWKSQHRNQIGDKSSD